MSKEVMLSSISTLIKRFTKPNTSSQIFGLTAKTYRVGLFPTTLRLDIHEDVMFRIIV